MSKNEKQRGMSAPQRVPSTRLTKDTHEAVIRFLVGLDPWGDDSTAIDFVQTPGFVYQDWCLIFHALVVGSDWFTAKARGGDWYIWDTIEIFHDWTDIDPYQEYTVYPQEALSPAKTDWLNEKCNGLWCWMPDRLYLSWPGDLAPFLLET